MQRSKEYKGKVRVGFYELDDGLKQLGNKKSKLRRRFSNLSHKLRNFTEHGVKCVGCGIKGTYFALEICKAEVQKGYKNPHLNLYAEGKGVHRLMTADHIKPVTLGGRDCLHNYQPMCMKCNGTKGKKYRLKEKCFHAYRLIKYRLLGKCGCNVKGIFCND